MNSLSTACQSVRALRYRLIKLKALPARFAGEALSVAIHLGVGHLERNYKWGAKPAVFRLFSFVLLLAWPLPD